jgi:DNA-binding transcriptional LysR family regulator
MREFLDVAPKIEISLWNHTSAAVNDAVLGRTVDFGLVVNPMPHPELVIVELFRDAVDVFVKKPDDGPAPTGDEARARLKAGPLIFAASSSISSPPIRSSRRGCSRAETSSS